MKANERNVACLKYILARYCSVSGQLVSVDKSSIVFSPSKEVNMKVEICSSLRIMTEALSDKYLGVSRNLSLDKVRTFSI